DNPGVQASASNFAAPPGGECVRSSSPCRRCQFRPGAVPACLPHHSATIELRLVFVGYAVTRPRLTAPAVASGEERFGIVEVGPPPAGRAGIVELARHVIPHFAL